MLSPVEYYACWLYINNDKDRTLAMKKAFKYSTKQAKECEQEFFNRVDVRAMMDYLNGDLGSADDELARTIALRDTAYEIATSVEAKVSERASMMTQYQKYAAAVERMKLRERDEEEQTDTLLGDLRRANNPVSKSMFPGNEETVNEEAGQIDQEDDEGRQEGKMLEEALSNAD